MRPLFYSDKLQEGKEDVSEAMSRVDFLYKELNNILENGLHEAYTDFNDYIPDFWAHLSRIKAERDLQMSLFNNDQRFESIAAAIEKKFNFTLTK